jgi:hypothetical protein
MGGNGKFGKGKGKAGGKGKAKDQGGDAHNKQDQITRPLVCHPSVLEYSEIIKHPTIALAPQQLREAERGWRHMEGKRMANEDQISSLQMKVWQLAEAPLRSSSRSAWSRRPSSWRR